MSRPNPIIPARKLARLADAHRLQNAARQHLQDAEEEAIRLKDVTMAEGRAEGLAQACADAAALLDEAQTQINSRFAALEDTLAALVAETVRDIIGDGDRDATVRAAVRTALARLEARDPSRLYVAQDMASPVQAALADLNTSLAVVVDEDLPDGIVLLSSEDGHAHIGLEAQLDNALAPLENKG